MTTSCLYHTQGIRGYQYKKTERLGKTEIYYVESSARKRACPHCQSTNTRLAQSGKTRDIKGLNVGSKKRFCELVYAG